MTDLIIYHLASTGIETYYTLILTLIVFVKVSANNNNNDDNVKGTYVNCSEDGTQGENGGHWGKIKQILL